MADTMFPGASALGDTAAELFNPSKDTANDYYQQIKYQLFHKKVHLMSKKLKD